MQENELEFIEYNIKDVHFKNILSSKLISIKFFNKDINSYDFIESSILKNFLNKKYNIEITSIFSFVIFDDFISISFEYEDVKNGND